MFINVSGTWKKSTKIFINVAGVWKAVSSVFINLNGVWKKLVFGGNILPISGSVPELKNQNFSTTLFYGDDSLWWIISIANPNKVNFGSVYLTPGIEIRIPINYSQVVSSFNLLNL